MGMNEERIINPADTADDQRLEVTLRPRTMAEYIGQAAMREKLGIYLEAARRRGGAKVDKTPVWSVDSPILVRSMVKAGPEVLIAGPKRL